MRVVVFGGSGFLGSHVADALTAKGFEVTIYDKTISPYLLPNQKMVVSDILDTDSVEKVVSTCDIVYNFAAIADIQTCKNNPIETIKINILGNTIILDACRKNKVKRFVFASSLYVYSNAGSFYRSSKQACESIIENYHRIFGLDYTILRYGSLYGPRADDTNWICSILKQALKENKIVRYGDGEELREYINIKDAARLSVEILSEDYKNECIILAGPQQIKVKDMLLMIKEILNNKIAIEYRSIDENSSPYDSELHYTITPYCFNPKTGKKLIGNCYVDIGQGILECLHEIYTTE